MASLHLRIYSSTIPQNKNIKGSLTKLKWLKSKKASQIHDPSFFDGASFSLHTFIILERRVWRMLANILGAN